MSSDCDYDEEEFYVFGDFKNQLLPYEIGTHPIKIIGIDTKNPIAEINGNIFKGSYDLAVGTNVCFEKVDTETNVDLVFEEPCKQQYKLLAKTNKIINFQRIYIDKEDTESEKNEESFESTKELPNLKIDSCYEDAIHQFPVFDEED